MHIYIISILLYFILTFAALWIIDIKNGENAADRNSYMLSGKKQKAKTKIKVTIYNNRLSL